MLDVSSIAAHLECCLISRAPRAAPSCPSTRLSQTLEVESSPSQDAVFLTAGPLPQRKGWSPRHREVQDISRQGRSCAGSQDVVEADCRQGDESER